VTWGSFWFLIIAAVIVACAIALWMIIWLVLGIKRTYALKRFKDGNDTTAEFRVYVSAATMLVIACVVYTIGLLLTNIRWDPWPLLWFSLILSSVLGLIRIYAYLALRLINNRRARRK